MSPGSLTSITVTSTVHLGNANTPPTMGRHDEGVFDRLRLSASQHGGIAIPLYVLSDSFLFLNMLCSWGWLILPKHRQRRMLNRSISYSACRVLLLLSASSLCVVMPSLASLSALHDAGYGDFKECIMSVWTNAAAARMLLWCSVSSF